MSECINCRVDLRDGRIRCNDCGDYFCFNCCCKWKSPEFCNDCSEDKIRNAVDNKDYLLVSNEELVEYLLNRFGLTKEEAQRHCLVSKLNKQ